MSDLHIIIITNGKLNIRRMQPIESSGKCFPLSPLREKWGKILYSILEPSGTARGFQNFLLASCIRWNMEPSGIIYIYLSLEGKTNALASFPLTDTTVKNAIFL